MTVSSTFHFSIDLSSAWNSGRRMIDAAVAMLPNLVLAVVAFIVFLVLARIAQSLVQRVARNRIKRPSVVLLFGRLIRSAVAILGFLVSLSIVAPSFRAGDLIKMLGIGSVAIGFAFQNILQNFLAGILLLLQAPFEIGDWINVTGLEGQVNDIQTRATVINGRDGQRIVIPNAIIFTNAVIVSGGGRPEQDGTVQHS